MRMFGGTKESQPVKTKNTISAFDTSIEVITSLSGLPKSHFEQFYRGPIERLIALSRHRDEALVLKHLESVAKALRLRKSVVLPIASDAESINAKKDLWTYTVFIAAISFRLNELVSYNVLVNHRNQMPAKWCPFDDPLDSGVVILDCEKVELTSTANILLLTLLFDSMHFTWLFRDPCAFNTVLNLCVRPDSRTELGRIILAAHGVPQTNSANLTHNEKPASVDDKKKNEPRKRDQFKEEAKAVGDSSTEIPPFTVWLNTAIKDSSHTYLVCNAMSSYGLSDPAIFVAYADQFGLDWEKVKTEFLNTVGDICDTGKMHFEGGGRKNALILPRDADLTSR